MEQAGGATLGVGKAGGGREARAYHADPLGVDEAWPLLLALRRRIDAEAGRGATVELGFALLGGRWLDAAPGRADLTVDASAGALRGGGRPLTAAARELLGLHLAHALRGRAQGYVTALLGQSLDGFIATRHGHSRYINGGESLTHLHRVRALSDAVVIGVGTALADAPRLTTRHCAGPHAVRVVIDPRGRLPADCGLLRDGEAPTLVLRAADGAPGEAALAAHASVLYLPATDGRIAPATVLAALAARGLTRLLIEGGGVTVGRFLEAGLLHRLQLAVAPLILGAGRPALPVAPVERLDQAPRPTGRRYLMGEDVLFDLCLERPNGSIGRRSRNGRPTRRRLARWGRAADESRRPALRRSRPAPRAGGARGGSAMSG